MRGRPPAFRIAVLVATVTATIGLTGPASAAPLTNAGRELATATTVMTISYPDGTTVATRSVTTAIVTPACPASRSAGVVGPACPGDPAPHAGMTGNTVGR